MPRGRPKAEIHRQQITLYLDQDQIEALDRVVKTREHETRHRISRSDIVREAVAKLIKQEEERL